MTTGKMMRAAGIVIAMTLATVARAGGLMTNTNYHIAFDRMMARGASTEIDAVYSNPAGIAWTHLGWQLSFNWQVPTQNRDITTTFPLFTDENHTHKFKGDASAPFVPGLFATYNTGKWAVGAMFGIVGSGGYVKYNEGVPMFTAPLITLLYSQSKGMLTPDTYTIDAQMKGKQYIYGGRLVGAYNITDNISAAAGVNINYYSGYYRGHVNAILKQPVVELVGMQLDCDQTGWGWSPFVSVDYHNDKLTLAARYEFRTKMNPKNKTNSLGANAINPATMQPMDQQTLMTLLGDKLSAYQDGAHTRYDMPALLSVAAGYEFTPKLRAQLEYHFFDDKHAKMANDRQKELTHGTQEVLAGVEYDINKTFTVSAGAQRTDYGLSDDFQTHTSFACDSWSVGLGGAVNLNEHLRINASYFWTMYSDYTKHTEAGVPGYCGTTLEGTDVFSRTNGVFGVGVDYKF